MGQEENKAIVRAFVEEVQTGGDLDAIEKYFAPSFFNFTQPPGFQDRRGVRKIHAALRTAFPDLRVKIIKQSADGDKVWTYKRFSGTHKGEWAGVPPTRKKVSFDVIDILTLKDGKITEHWHVMDQLGIYQQMGARPPTA